MPDRAPHPFVQFHFLNSGITLKNRKNLKAFLASLFKKEKTVLGSLTYIFCNDEYLLDINQRFLKHNYYTDIITFNLAKKNERVEGEIYISLDRVIDNAQKLNQPRIKELHRVIFHGALHLCGYRDKSKSEVSKMRLAEDHYLAIYFKK